MATYKKLYYSLFNDITDVINIVGELQANTLGKETSKIEACELTPIIDKLKDIQIKAEQMHIESENQQ